MKSSKTRAQRYHFQLLDSQIELSVNSQQGVVRSRDNTLLISYISSERLFSKRQILVITAFLPIIG